MPRPRPFLDPFPVALRRLVGDRHGLLTARQLAEAGLDRDAIQRYGVAGLLHSIQRGVWSLMEANHLTVAARVAAARICVDDGVACPTRLVFDACRRCIETTSYRSSMRSCALGFSHDRTSTTCDRRRADDLAAHGWRLIRVTWDDVTRNLEDVVRRIRRALATAA